MHPVNHCLRKNFFGKNTFFFKNSKRKMFEDSSSTRGGERVKLFIDKARGFIHVQLYVT